jgi:hypothetical protein
MYFIFNSSSFRNVRALKDANLMASDYVAKTYLCCSVLIFRKRDDNSCHGDAVVSASSQQLSAGPQQPMDHEGLRIELSSLKAYCDKLNDEKTQALQEANVLKVLVLHMT